MAGPIDSGYAASTAVKATAVHFAHRSRRFTTRTANQTANAENATPITDSTTAIPGFYLRKSGEGMLNARGLATFTYDTFDYIN